MINAILFWILFIVVSALADYWIINKEKIEIDDEGHILRTIIRAVVGIICAAIGGYGFGYGLAFMFFEAASFWLFFDVLLNILRKRDALYVGFNSKIDVYFRYHFPTNPETIMFCAKVFALFLSIIILIFI